MFLIFINCVFLRVVLHFKPGGYFFVPPGLTFNTSTLYPHRIFLCFLCVSEQIIIIIIIIIIIYLTANGLSPSGSGYNAGT